MERMKETLVEIVRGGSVCLFDIISLQHSNRVLESITLSVT